MSDIDQPVEMIVRNASQYFNKGRRCIWIETHNGTNFKFIVDEAPEAPQQLHITSAPTVPTDEAK